MAANTERWTDEEDDLLRKLHSEGLSASQMIPYLPVRAPTRNAVIGRLNRLGLTGNRPKRLRSSLPVKPTRDLDRADRRQAARVKVSPLTGVETMRALAARMKAALPVEKMPSPVAVDPSGGIELLDLAPHHCRYPLTDESPWLFCGKDKQEGSSMCRFHHSLCYVKPDGRARQERQAA